MRLVLDTNIVASGLFWNGTPAQLIDAARTDEIEIFTSDPDDDHVLACAMAAQAEFIVSGDRHLLDLKEHQGIRIVTAAEAVALLAGE